MTGSATEAERASPGPLRETLERWWVRGGFAAAVAASIELGCVLWVFPTAGSDELGLLATWLGAFWVFALALLPALAGCAWLDRSGHMTRLLPGRGALFHALVCVALGLAALAAVEAPAYARLQIRIRELRALGFMAVLGGVWLSACALRRALRRWAPGLSTFGATHGRHLVLIGSAAASAWAIHFVLGPANADTAVWPLAMLELCALLLASRALVSDAARLPRWLGPTLALFWLAAPVLWATSAHARFVVRGHCPTATSLWAPLDRAFDLDGDGSSPRWLGGTDCAELDAARGPLLREVPGDGVDQDCWGGDADPPAAPSIAGPWVGCSAPPDASVLLLSIDALRADAVSPELMPEIARFAAHATRFERAYPPASMTGGTTLSAMMGRATIDLSAKNVYVDPEIVVSETFAERFRARGFRTFAFVPFELHPAILNGFEPPAYAKPRDRSVETHKRLMAAELSNQLLEEIAGSAQRFLGWAHYPDLHAPYILSRPEDGGASANGYARAAAYVDAHVGRVLRELHASDRLRSTVVIITSDHGEQLGERGREGHGPLLFEEGIRIPLILWVPGCPPRRVPYPVNLRHLAGTLDALVAAGLPQSTWFSPTALPVVVEEPNAAWNGVKRAVLLGQYKLIVDMRLGGQMLFDLARDPGEIENLYASRPDIAFELTRAYQRWLDSPLVR